MKNVNWKALFVCILIGWSGSKAFSSEAANCEASLHGVLMLDPVLDVTPIKKEKSHRNFVRITEAQLKEKLAQALKRITGAESYASDFDFVNDLNQMSLELNSKVTADLGKVSFDSDELEAVGFKTLENGLVYYGFVALSAAGGETFYMLYWDGQVVRGYIPVAGNLWNTKAKNQYGENGILDIVDLKKRFPKLIDRRVEDDDEAIEYFEELRPKLHLNFELMNQEMMARISEK